MNLPKRRAFVLFALLTSSMVACAVPITFSSGDSFGPGRPAASVAFGGVYNDALGSYGSISILVGGYGGLSGPAFAADVQFPGDGALLSLVLTDWGGFGTIMGLGPLTSEQQKSDLLSGLAYVNIHTASNPGGEVAANLVGSGGARVPEGGIPLALTGLVLVSMAAFQRVQRGELAVVPLRPVSIPGSSVNDHKENPRSSRSQ